MQVAAGETRRIDAFPFAVGVAERTAGPGTDDWPGLPSYQVTCHEPLGRYLHAAGVAAGFDLAVTEEFGIDHSIIVPLHFLNAGMRRPIVPVFVNGIAPPLPTARRCYALGAMVRDAIAAWPHPARVAILASGCLSGDIGGPRAIDGQPFAPADRDWVFQAVGRMARGEIDELLNDATAERLAAAGNVSGEMLNWIALLGAVGERKPRFLEPQPDGGNAYGAWRWDA